MSIAHERHRLPAGRGLAALCLVLGTIAAETRRRAKHRAGGPDLLHRGRLAPGSRDLRQGERRRHPLGAGRDLAAEHEGLRPHPANHPDPEVESALLQRRHGARLRMGWLRLHVEPHADRHQRSGRAHHGCRHSRQRPRALLPAVRLLARHRGHCHGDRHLCVPRAGQSRDRVQGVRQGRQGGERERVGREHGRPRDRHQPLHVDVRIGAAEHQLRTGRGHEPRRAHHRPEQAVVQLRLQGRALRRHQHRSGRRRCPCAHAVARKRPVGCARTRHPQELRVRPQARLHVCLSRIRSHRAVGARRRAGNDRRRATLSGT